MIDESPTTNDESQSRNPFLLHPSQLTSATAFTRFPDLPFELRTKIWNLTISPRVYLFRSAAHLPVPSLLQIHRESRAEGLRHYELAAIRSLDDQQVTSVYFNMSEDTLLVRLPSRNALKESYIEHVASNTIIEKIHHIALTRAFWEGVDIWPSYSLLYHALRESKNLKSITITHRPNYRTKFLGGLWDLDLIEDENAWEDAKDDLGTWRYDLKETVRAVPEWNKPEWNCPHMTIARLETPDDV